MEIGIGLLVDMVSAVNLTSLCKVIIARLSYCLIGLVMDLQTASGTNAT